MANTRYLTYKEYSEFSDSYRKNCSSETRAQLAMIAVMLQTTFFDAVVVLHKGDFEGLCYDLMLSPWTGITAQNYEKIEFIVIGSITIQKSKSLR